MNKNGSKWITRERRLALYIRDGFACAYCGTDLRNARPAEVTLDHLVCRVSGGGNESANLVTACRSCNSSRGDRSYEDFAPGGAQDRIAHLIAQPVNIELAKAIIAGTAGDPRLEDR
jgi:5-methylcytosine-specific restriction endonuclease McrA